MINEDNNNISIKNEMKDAQQMLLEFAWQVYNKQHQYFDGLDQKASYLTGFIGLFLTFVSGFSFSVFFEDTNPSTVSVVYLIIIFKILLSLLIIFITLSLLFSIRALRIRKISDIAKVNTIKEFIRNLETENKPARKKTLAYIVNSIELATKSLQDNCDYKSLQIKRSIRFLTVSLFVGFTSIVIYLIIGSIN
jgi:hypothetical protein